MPVTDQMALQGGTADIANIVAKAIGVEVPLAIHACFNGWWEISKTSLQGICKIENKSFQKKLSTYELVVQMIKHVVPTISDDKLLEAMGYRVQTNSVEPYILRPGDAQELLDQRGQEDNRNDLPAAER